MSTVYRTSTRTGRISRLVLVTYPTTTWFEMIDWATSLEVAATGFTLSFSRSHTSCGTMPGTTHSVWETHRPGSSFRWLAIAVQLDIPSTTPICQSPPEMKFTTFDVDNDLYTSGDCVNLRRRVLDERLCGVCLSWSGSSSFGTLYHLVMVWWHYEYSQSPIDWQG